MMPAVPSSPWPDAGALRAIRRRGQAAARRFRLPFRTRIWRGGAGNWAGAGVGSSIDFQDHRPYVPGDDPRHINWQAYARTGHYSMKLYREEVSPCVDLVFDGSGSMLFEETKLARSLEAFHFCAESALRSGAWLRAALVRGDEVTVLPLERILGPEPEWPTLDPRRDGHAAIARAPMRPASIRVLVSDCLFPGEPDALLRKLSASGGLGVVLAPTSEAESDPTWSGNVEFRDCESGLRRIQRVEEGLLSRFRSAYQRHFETWKESSRRHGVAFSRIAADGTLEDALGREALAAGAIELWS